MRILMAEDDPVSRKLLEISLSRWGHEAVSVADGDAAWDVLQRPDRPLMAVLDLMMPGLSGIDVCRKVRAAGGAPIHILMLTTLSDKRAIVEALEAGAYDYVTKPFTPEELRARIAAGVRVVELENRLADRVRELEKANAELKELRGIIPMCSYCKKVRSDQNFWERVEGYISTRTGAKVSHGVCPECTEKFMRDDPDLMKPAK
ncbi:MAG: response regulator transcription factor [Planctomycetes bacterium]|nr:response regulator transcription factor [Planctomycetota bacterium]